MTKYILKRTAASLFTVFIVATLTFALMKAVPGSPFTSEKANVIVETSLNEKYGLDKPIYVQYGIYLEQLIHGDLGISYKVQKNAKVVKIIKTTFPVSARMGGLAILLALGCGIPLGCIGALRNGKWQDNVIRIFSTCGIAIPSFVIASISMLIFAVKLKWVPSLGLSSPKSYILPVLSLTFYPMCYIARLMRASMLEALGQDYIRTARAKGMSERVTTFKHALRNSLIPVITYVGPMIAYTLVGAFVVEKIFNIPGLGRYFIKAIENRDYSLIMGTTVFLAVLIIVMNLFCDILYKVVDPRIKLGE
jgi:oligopeptide transport system permease protein